MCFRAPAGVSVEAPLPVMVVDADPVVVIDAGSMAVEIRVFGSVLVPEASVLEAVVLLCASLLK